ncbi:MAG: hypothetical protein OEZ43_10270 [Gammaproteobacteria bacterium]|nr:hypothetical protein [Gammaproteobacteria bacterium]
MNIKHMMSCLVVVVSLLSACDDQPGKVDKPDEEPNLNPSNFLAYKITRRLSADNTATVELKARSLDNIEKSVDVETSADGSIRVFPNGFQVGQYSSENYRISNYHTHKIVYTNEGKLYLLPVHQVTQPVARQLSSENDGYNICLEDNRRANDYADPDNSRMVYKKVFTSEDRINCASKSGAWFMVNISDNDSVTPKSLPNSLDFIVTAIHDPASGSLSGWLVVENGALSRYDIDFSSSSQVVLSGSPVTVGSRVRLLTRTHAKHFILNVDEQILIYDAITNTIVGSKTAFKAPAGGRIGRFVTSDGEQLFFTVDLAFDDQNQATQSDLYALDMTDGNVTKLHSENAGIGKILVAKNYLIFGYEVSPSWYYGLRLKKIVKTGGVAVEVVRPENANAIYDMYAHGDYFYVNYVSNDRHFTLYRIEERETQSSAINHHRLVGVVFSNELNPARFFLDPQYFVVVQNDIDTGTKNLHVIEANTGAMKVIGALPQDTNLDRSFDFIETLGHTHVLLGIFNNSGIKDLFYFDATKDGSLQRLTQGAGSNQSAIYYKPGL